MGVRVAVRVEVGVRVIVTLPSGTGKVAVRVLVGTRVAVIVGLGVEVRVDAAEAVTVGVAFPKPRDEDQRLMVPHPSTMITKPTVRAIMMALQETFRGRLVRLRGARKCSGRGAACWLKNTGHSRYFPPRQNSSWCLSLTATTGRQR